ncbi:MAG: PhoH family protein, partial [Pseudomonadota bacterium]|nr:PhoH family protein [Pseudomonadota bacterium]
TASLALVRGDLEPAAPPRQSPAALVPAVPTAMARPSRPPEATPRSRRTRGDGPATLFVLDTNVLMHDPTSLFRFEEHDVYLPMITLEELDGHKRGMTEVARNARQVSRDLDALASNMPSRDAAGRSEGIALARTGHREAGGKLFFQTDLIQVELPQGLPQGKADNQILGVVKALCEQQPGRPVVLVSKDINMRIKARALGLPAEDYFNDKTLDDGDLLYTGVLQLPTDFWDKEAKTVESWQQGGLTYYRVGGPVVGQFLINQFVYHEPAGAPALYAKVIEITGKTAVLRTVRDYAHQKNAVWGVTARNRDQNFALNLLLDPECDFITLTGTAGSGKTLMSLAAGLAQVMDDRRYTEIIVTRVTVPVGEDIGFLPGTEEEKMGPWMGALDDNLEVLAKTDSGAGEWGRAATNDLVRSKIKIKSLNFMRGRTFLNKYVIIDEAQNLTPKQMKTLITRAGPGTKIVCLGNLAQIDTPYLTEGSSGLTYAVDRFKGWAHSGHVTLARGERSRLADFASEVL